ncbi:hypothetical protein F66182_14752, partial [Fusarium sp. NRRL 66182]
MDSPAGFSDTAMDQDDIPYPCKGCGEILEEGKAFELAGNRFGRPPPAPRRRLVDMQQL